MKNITTFEAHLNKQYGKKGTAKRDEFEKNSKLFRVIELIKEAKKQAKITSSVYN